ncbi:MAG: hypothetical protein AABX01_03245 [Candidatus Micrarchaeota archaeon]
METVAKFEGVTEYLLEKMVAMGYFQTRTEALRAGILQLGKEFHILKSGTELEDELAIKKIGRVEEDIRKGKRKLHSLEDVMKEEGILKSDLK